MTSSFRLTSEDLLVCNLCWAVVPNEDPRPSIEDTRTPAQKHLDWHKYLNATFQLREVGKE